MSADQRLSESALNHLRDGATRVLLRAVVVWEIALRRSLGTLDAPDEYLSLLLGAGAQPLAVSIGHAVAVEFLPWHHRDPFDRMLIAQASLEARRSCRATRPCARTASRSSGSGTRR